MDTAQIRDVLDWMKSTDLVEVAFKRSGRGFALSTADAPAAISGGSMPASRFVPVSAESVGVFQWAAPGKARTTEEGSDVAEGAAAPDGGLAMRMPRLGPATPGAVGVSAFTIASDFGLAV